MTSLNRLCIGHRQPQCRPAQLALSVAMGLALASGLATAGDSETIIIRVDTPQKLTDAIHQANSNPGMPHQIEIEIVELQLQSIDPVGAPGNAVPLLNSEVHLMPAPGTGRVTLRGGGMGSNFRFARIGPVGTLVPRNVDFEDFHVEADGGVLYGDPGSTIGGKDGPPISFRNNRSSGNGGGIYNSGGTLIIDNAVFENNHASGNGGGLFATNPVDLIVEDSLFSGNQAGIGGGVSFDGPGDIRRNEFLGNHASNLGGGIDIGRDGRVLYNRFTGNTAGVFGCGANVNAPGGQEPILVQGNQFNGPGCTNVRGENPAGDMYWFFNTSQVDVVVRVLDSTTQDFFFMGSTLSDVPFQTVPRKLSVEKVVCADFGSGAFGSLGANIATDSSCALNQPTDLVTATPGLLAPDSKGHIAVSDSSPAIERGPSGIVTVPVGMQTKRIIPCGYRDIRGLGRPQDNDGDGNFNCDSGSWEKQGGSDIAGPQTGVYFDAARNGEGHFIELIGGGLAIASTFTYGPNGGMAWFSGVGNVVGNSVVVDDMQVTSGGVFGASFNEKAIVRERAGGASFVFPNCAASAQPGHFAFQADRRKGFEDLSAKALRVVSPTLSCAGTPAPLAHRSGSYFPVGRSGEGILLQYLPDGTAALVFYSYTPQGQQFWAVSTQTTVVGDTLTAQMVYPATSTRFGSGFVVNEIDLQPWGTITLTHNGCSTANFAYNSSVAGYGSGSHTYTRLSVIDGTTCQ